MRGPLAGLGTAFAFLTVLPVPVGDYRPAGAVIWYAPVGLAVGGALAGVAAGTHELAPPALAAAGAVAAWVAVTGALHLDGLADTADAAVASVDRDRRLAILRDPNHGTFALAAVVTILLLKWSALVGAGGRGELVALALAAPVVARGSIPLAAALFPAARAEGMGAAMREGATVPAVAVGLAGAVAVGIVAAGLAGVIAAAVAGASALAGSAWLSARFRGLNGDAYGALVECAEAVTLVGLAVAFYRGWGDPFPLWS